MHSDKELLDETEKEEIELRKYYLSVEAGYDVGWKFAYKDWVKIHSKKWRKHRMKKDIEDEIKKILRHKWIESEKAGCDLGDRAVLDWINKYAAKWRASRRSRKQESCY